MALAVALLALLVAVFTLVALVAVYARVRQLEAGRAVELSGYASLIGRVAPAAVHPARPDELSVVAVLDDGCALCHAVWSEFGAIADELPGAPARLLGVLDKPSDGADGRADHAAGNRADAAGNGAGDGVGDPAGFPAHPRVELLADTVVRADLFEGYSPTLLAVDGSGKISYRSFVYRDTDVRALLRELVTDAVPQGRRE